jgi:membrane protein implicated in regulation of membrane protease activity
VIDHHDPMSVGGAAYRRSTPHRKAVIEQFEIFIGFLAFWGLILLVVTVWLEVTGQPALGWALGLLAVLLAIAGLWKLRRRVLRGEKDEFKG